MRNLAAGTAILCSILLSACTSTTTLPAGPSTAVMPGKNKSFEAFQDDNAVCMQYARAQIDVDPQEQARNSTLSGVAAGAVLGAAAGAAVGDSSRAAGVGAGTGALVGAAVGNNNAVRSTRQLQRRYDIAYEQCMFAKGNDLPPRVVAPVYRPVIYSEPAYYPPPPHYYERIYEEPGYCPPHHHRRAVNIRLRR